VGGEGDDGPGCHAPAQALRGPVLGEELSVRVDDAIDARLTVVGVRRTIVVEVNQPFRTRGIPGVEHGQGTVVRPLRTAAAKQDAPIGVASDAVWPGASVHRVGSRVGDRLKIRTLVAEAYRALRRRAGRRGRHGHDVLLLWIVGDSWHRDTYPATHVAQVVD